MVALERELTDRSPTVVAPTTADAIPLALRRRGASARQVLAMTFVGMLALALFASRDLPSWSERLGDGPTGLAAQKMAARWDEAMASLGLTRPHVILRDLIRSLLDAQW